MIDLEHDRRLNEFLLQSLEQFERRLERIENSLLFRVNRAVGGWLGTRWRKLGQILLRSPLHALLPTKPANNSEYRDWVRREEATLTAPPLHRQPPISLLMATHNSKRAWLQEAVASLQNQSYPCWELCICDDASAEPWLRSYLEELAASDARIKITFSTHPLGISQAFNAAGALAKGEYVAYLDHDDVLHPRCLEYIAAACQDPAVQIVYTDEDCLEAGGERVNPRFKPDWSPELLLSCMYFGHLFVVRRELAKLRKECDGAQDWDLALRLTDGPVVVRHVPRVLYHWRRHAASTAGNPAAKPYTQGAGRRTLEQTINRRGIRGTVEDTRIPNVFQIRYEVAGNPKASLVVCSRKENFFVGWRRSIEAHTRYPNVEIVLVEHVGTGPHFRAENLHGLIHTTYAGEFNFAAMNNLGASLARGGILIFVNDDAEPVDPEWLDRLVGHVLQPGVGIAGTRLLYPSGAVQHAGIALGMMDGVGHPGRGLFRSDLFPWMEMTRNVSAVTGACLAIRKEVFDELGGFDPRFPVNFNDVDLCLRAREKGYEVVYDNSVMLIHRESATRVGGTRLRERLEFYLRWGQRIKQCDPYFPRALDRTTESARLQGPSCAGLVS